MLLTGACPLENPAYGEGRMDDSFTPVPPPLIPPAPPVQAFLPPPGGGPPGRPSKPSGHGWAWAWGVVLAIVVVAGGVAFKVVSHFTHSFGHLGQLSKHRSPGAAELSEEVLEDNEAHDKIAVIPVEGVISSSGESGYNLVELIRNQLARAGEDDHVKAVVLRIDSPGGEVLASDEIADALRDFQDGDHGKPVVVSMQSLCASGGYYISAPCRWIVAHELTITGSIGVIFHGYNFRGLMDKVGVRSKVTKSGKLKDMWSPDKLPEEELPEEKSIMQDLVEESFTRFKKVIREGRGWAAKENRSWLESLGTATNNISRVDSGRTLVEDWEAVADGRVMSGTTALEYGFIDELGNFEVAVERAEKLSGIEKANLITYSPPSRFPGLLRLLGESNVKSVKLDLSDLGALLPKLPQGRLYFLSPAFLH